MQRFIESLQGGIAIPEDVLYGRTCRVVLLLVENNVLSVYNGALLQCCTTVSTAVVAVVPFSPLF